MFSVYFATSYFPVGWGAVGDLPEGSISGGTTLQVTASATWSALASVAGSAALQVTAEGTASTSEAGGSASITITAAGTLTFTGEATGGGIVGRFRRAPRQAEDRHPVVVPGWMAGSALLRIAAIGRPIFAKVVEPEPVRDHVQSAPLPAPWCPPELPFPAPTAHRPVGPAVVVAVEVRAVRPAPMDGSAALVVDAAGALGFTRIDPPEPEAPEDDTDMMALVLALLEAA